MLVHVNLLLVHMYSYFFTAKTDLVPTEETNLRNEILERYARGGLALVAILIIAHQRLGSEKTLEPAAAALHWRCAREELAYASDFSLVQLARR